MKYIEHKINKKNFGFPLEKKPNIKEYDSFDRIDFNTQKIFIEMIAKKLVIKTVGDSVFCIQK